MRHIYLNDVTTLMHHNTITYADDMHFFLHQNRIKTCQNMSGLHYFHVLNLLLCCLAIFLRECTCRGHFFYTHNGLKSFSMQNIFFELQYLKCKFPRLPSYVLIFCVEFWELPHLTHDLS